MRLAEAAFLEVPRCTGFIDLRVCPNLVSVAALPPGSWLVQAKLRISGDPAGTIGVPNRCGLVEGPPVSNDATVHDQDEAVLADGQVGSEDVTLMDVVTTTDVTRIGVRCTAPNVFEPHLAVRDLKLTALEVANVVGHLMSRANPASPARGV